MAHIHGANFGKISTRPATVTNAELPAYRSSTGLSWAEQWKLRPGSMGFVTINTLLFHDDIRPMSAGRLRKAVDLMAAQPLQIKSRVGSALLVFPSLVHYSQQNMVLHAGCVK